MSNLFLRRADTTNVATQEASRDRIVFTTQLAVWRGRAG
jgi:hypothetical protein